MFLTYNMSDIKSSWAEEIEYDIEESVNCVSTNIPSINLCDALSDVFSAFIEVSILKYIEIYIDQFRTEYRIITKRYDKENYTKPKIEILWKGYNKPTMHTYPSFDNKNMIVQVKNISFECISKNNKKYWMKSNCFSSLSLVNCDIYFKRRFPDNFNKWIPYPSSNIGSNKELYCENYYDPHNSFILAKVNTKIYPYTSNRRYPEIYSWIYCSLPFQLLRQQIYYKQTGIEQNLENVFNNKSLIKYSFNKNIIYKDIFNIPVHPDLLVRDSSLCEYDYNEDEDEEQYIIDTNNDLFRFHCLESDFDNPFIYRFIIQYIWEGKNINMESIYECISNTINEAFENTKYTTYSIEYWIDKLNVIYSAYFNKYS